MEQKEMPGAVLEPMIDTPEPIEEYTALSEEPKEEVENLDEEKMTRQIKSTQSLEELLYILNSIKEIQGTSDKYVFKGSELAQIIEGVKNKEYPLEGVTRTWGIRDKVYEFLGDDVISTELEERKIEQQKLAENQNNPVPEQPPQENIPNNAKELDELLEKASVLYSEFEIKKEELLEEKRKQKESLMRRMFSGKKLRELEEASQRAFEKYQFVEKQYMQLQSKTVLADQK